MTGWCPYIKEGTLKEQECHFDGYCSECPYHNEQTERSEYETAVENQEHCERYEPTYNLEDGSI